MHVSAVDRADSKGDFSDITRILVYTFFFGRFSDTFGLEKIPRSVALKKFISQSRDSHKKFKMMGLNRYFQCRTDINIVPIQ
jgi:hypothetical protein